jgi:hypothetical protein
LSDRDRLFLGGGYDDHFEMAASNKTIKVVDQSPCRDVARALSSDVIRRSAEIDSHQL